MAVRGYILRPLGAAKSNNRCENASFFEAFVLFSKPLSFTALFFVKMDAMSHKPGKVIIPASVSPWGHELKSAHTLARHGFTVEFVAVSNNHKAKTADIVIRFRYLRAELYRG